jgi:uncharacterized protein YciI
VKYFAAIIKTVDNVVEKRAPYRQEHLERLNRLKAEGKLALAGAWNDPVDGALIIYRADSKEEVEQLVKEDVYYTAGLWPEFTVREWNVVIQ